MKNFPYRNRLSQRNSLSMLTVLLLGLMGCGSSEPKPNLIVVTGKVTLDGNPVEGATVAFNPKAMDANGHGRPSMGGTTAEGTYELFYIKNQSGALVGEHSVTISKLDGTPDVPGEELIPARYNTESQLTATVTESGPQTIDFELKSKR